MKEKELIFIRKIIVTDNDVTGCVFENGHFYDIIKISKHGNRLIVSMSCALPVELERAQTYLDCYNEVIRKAKELL